MPADHMVTACFGNGFGSRTRRLTLRLSLLASIVLLLSCGRNPTFQARDLLPGGNPDRGSVLMQQYGCPSCHVIPGVKGAYGHVGPPLTQISLRTYLAGRALNT